jgi:predicted dienelactone hydrolase
MKTAALSLVLLALLSAPGQAQPPARPGVDAPELAALGPHGVGVRSIALIEPDTPDVLAHGPAKGAAPLKDRRLDVDIWYPAKVKPGAPSVVYADHLPSEVKGETVAFTQAGLATRDAAPDGKSYPLVVMSHGYSGTPVAMSWLAENLASKGYVVAAPHHRDPPINEPGGFAEPLFLRSVDVAFVAHALQSKARRGEAFFGDLIDPDRVALAGYSMGGYGVLTAAGALVSPAAAGIVPGGALTAYAKGGPKAKDLHIDGLKAVVAISPAGGSAALNFWNADGLAALRAPTLFLVGDQDRVVGYAPGVKSIFDAAVNAPRYMLVFENGGHSIGMNGAPDTMRSRLWDLDWWEDPVWRKERVIGVNLHMITAFLDLYVKGDQTRAAYLDLSPSSNDGKWAAVSGGDYAAFSPGAGGITVWKGFQHDHAIGLEFFRAAPAKP